jgi:hypothetical protein
MVAAFGGVEAIAWRLIERRADANAAMLVIASRLA